MKCCMRLTDSLDLPKSSWKKGIDDLSRAAIPYYYTLYYIYLIHTDTAEQPLSEGMIACLNSTVKTQLL